MNERIEKVRKLMKERELDGMIIDHPIDVFYLTGIELSLGRIVVTQQQATLFVDGRYIEGCRKAVSMDVIETKGYAISSAFGSWWNFAGKRIGFDADTTAYSVYLDLEALGSLLVPLKGPLKRIREIKDAAEITALRKAASLGSKGYDHVIHALNKNITEEEIAIELELFWRKSGGQKLAFAPHIAFGANSSQPHYHSGKSTLQLGDPVLIDIGVVCNHYHSDMTRVIFYGMPSSQLEKIYVVVKEAQRRALDACKPGTLIKNVDKTARDWIQENGYGDFFPHSLGHGVGLEIHESPVIRGSGIDAERPLEAGMVITIEPGIYLPGVGGVRLEDTVLITSNGYENLTARPFGESLPILNTASLGL